MEIDELLEKPYWITDILPEQVPECRCGQYAAVEAFYLQEQQLSVIRRKYLNVILKLSCYYDLCISTREGENRTEAPDPKTLEARIMKADPTEMINFLFGSGNILAVMDKGDTYITVYNPDERFLGLLNKLANAEGLFVWRPETDIWQ